MHMPHKHHFFRSQKQGQCPVPASVNVVSLSSKSLLHPARRYWRCMVEKRLLAQLAQFRLCLVEGAGGTAQGRADARVSLPGSGCSPFPSSGTAVSGLQKTQWYSPSRELCHTSGHPPAPQLPPADCRPTLAHDTLVNVPHHQWAQPHPLQPALTPQQGGWGGVFHISS